VVLAKPFYLIHFQRAIVFVQASLDLNVMTPVLSDRFRVLNAVALLVAVVFYDVVFAVFAHIAPNVGVADAVRGRLLVVVILALILSQGASRANNGKSYGCKNCTLHFYFSS
jgi:hypothetical protein